jgi:hypothetical protein
MKRNTMQRNIQHQKKHAREKAGKRNMRTSKEKSQRERNMHGKRNMQGGNNMHGLKEKCPV